jgi:hypothetical protein
MLNLSVIAAVISTAAAIVSWWKARRGAAVSPLKTDTSELARLVADAKRHAETAQRAALASLTHSKTSLAHSESAKKAAPSVIPEMISGVISAEPVVRKTRRELVADAARSPENLARVTKINEERALTSPLIPGNDQEAQTNHAAWRARMSKR